METRKLKYELGTFEGFNHREQTAIYPNQTGDQVVSWDHNTKGEAEFWPSGDCPDVSLLFQSESYVSGGELLHLDQLLCDLGNDNVETYLRIFHVARNQGICFEQVTFETVEDSSAQFFTGTSFIDLRREAAFDLFELYYPEEYTIWEKSTCDGLIFDEDRFLDSPVFSTHEITIGEIKALIVESN